jgi:hypothetical protein
MENGIQVAKEYSMFKPDCIATGAVVALSDIRSSTA